MLKQKHDVFRWKLSYLKPKADISDSEIRLRKLTVTHSLLSHCFVEGTIIPIVLDLNVVAESVAFQVLSRAYRATEGGERACN